MYEADFIDEKDIDMTEEEEGIEEDLGGDTEEEPPTEEIETPKEEEA